MSTLTTVRPIEVAMGDGTTATVRELLTDGDSNVKLAKSNKLSRYLTWGLSLAPHTSAGLGNVCPQASPGCIKACIFSSGYASVFASIGWARIAKTRAFFLHREAFKAMLIRDIKRAVRKARKERKKVAIRLNVFSDLPWEKLMPELFTMFPKVQFYDYTKVTSRALAHARGEFPANYHLTFSRSECNAADVAAVLAAGGNVSAVFATKELPATWGGVEVVNGDQTDLRFLDGKSVVVGLYAKGQGKKDDSGFVIDNRRIGLNVLAN